MARWKSAEIGVGMKVWNANALSFANNAPQQTHGTGISFQVGDDVLRHADLDPRVEGFLGIITHTQGHVFGAGKQLGLPHDGKKDFSEVGFMKLGDRFVDCGAGAHEVFKLGAQICLGGAGVIKCGLGALTLGDVAHQALPAPIGKNLRADLYRHISAVFAPQLPL